MQFLRLRNTVINLALVQHVYFAEDGQRAYVYFAGDHYGEGAVQLDAKGAAALAEWLNEYGEVLIWPDAPTPAGPAEVDEDIPF